MSLSWPALVPCMAVMFGAGIVRGFAGFGLSAPCVAGMSLFVPPALMLRSGWRLALPPTPGLRLATGLESGLVNGVAAIGGIAVAVPLSAAPLAPAAMRATLILLFLFTDLYAPAWAATLPSGQGVPLPGAGNWQLAMWLAPAMLAGIQVGQRTFAGVSTQPFRRRVLDLLALVAGLSVLRALLALFPG